MKHIAAADVSAQLSTLLDEVARGEEITILRDGKPVARLVATQDGPARAADYSPEEIERRREIVRRVRTNAREMNLNVTRDEIKSWIEDGRG